MEQRGCLERGTANMDAQVRLGDRGSLVAMKQQKSTQNEAAACQRREGCGMQASA